MENIDKPCHKACAIKAGALLGILAVVLGSMGAHVPTIQQKIIDHDARHLWAIASQYHYLHAVALVAIGAWCVARGLKCAMKYLTATFLWGTVLFAGSLYGLAVGGPQWLSYVSPVGGVLLLVGWVMLFAAALKSECCGPNCSCGCGCHEKGKSSCK